MTDQLENTPILRYCLVPGCRAEFDFAAAVDGRRSLRPEWSGEGWQRIRAGVPLASGYACPDHADLVVAHLPVRPVAVADGWAALACSCGTWSSCPHRWHGAVRGLWEEHLLEVSGLLPQATPLAGPASCSCGATAWVRTGNFR